MTLAQRQQIFAKNVAYLILEIYTNGDACTFGEAWRTPEMAEINAKKGVGIKNSLHIQRLAIDLNLFKDGIYTDDVEDYRHYGDYWKELNPDNNWGGDFIKLHDQFHFSMSDRVSKTK